MATMEQKLTASEVNAGNRIDHLPMSPVLTSWIGILGSMMLFAVSYSLSAGFALPGIARYFHLSPTLAAVVVSTGAFGSVFGSLFFGTLMDSVGRKTGILSR